MENWRAGVAARLQVDYDVLAAINPRLIYASASGFGQTGKYAHKATVDWISQAMGGYFSLTGPEGGPGERPRFIVIDLTSPLTFVQAILLSLLAREDSGKGQWAQCSQTETLIAVGSVRVAEYFASGETPRPWGSGSRHAVPGQAFLAADGYILVECPTEPAWRALCETLLLPGLAEDPRFDSNARRVEQRETLLPILKQAFLRYSGQRWLDRLEAAGRALWPRLPGHRGPLQRAAGRRERAAGGPRAPGDGARAHQRRALAAQPHARRVRRAGGGHGPRPRRAAGRDSR